MNDDRPQLTSFESAHLILTSRNVDQLGWLNPYLDRILKNSGSQHSKFKLHIYLTPAPKIDDLSSFLFWRGFHKLQS